MNSQQRKILQNTINSFSPIDENDSVFITTTLLERFGDNLVEDIINTLPYDISEIVKQVYT